MGLLRHVLLAGAGSAWLRRQATRHRFVRRAVSRFMPGETLDDAVRAAAGLAARRLGAILTYLGENVADRSEAEAVTRHYEQVAERIHAEGLDAQISIKLTQLGLDVDPGSTEENVARIATRARDLGNTVWIDMESSAYTDRTLQAYRRLAASHSNLGLCLQAYLRRTRSDLEALLALGARIRLVKGAYDEPRDLSFRSRREVDESFLAIAERLLDGEARRAGAQLTLGTHDGRLIRWIADLAASKGIPRDGYEIAMLYGIQRREQQRLAAEGHRVRVLVSYGDHWFPWYMRRLAERPANLLFVLRNLVPAGAPRRRARRDAGS